jgi:ribose transport system substrate-binding protein
MKNHKLITDIFVIILALGLFILWYETKYQNHIAASALPANEKIYLITMDKTSQYWYYINDGVSAMANLLGITYIWDAPQTRSVEGQINVIREAVANGADALMIAAIDPVKVSGAIEDAKALGVKIIYVDSPAYEEGIVTLATDNYSAGIAAGNTMLLQLKSDGIKSGTIGIIGSYLTSKTTMDREKGFRDTINSDGRFTLLDTLYASQDKVLAQTMAASLITEHPDLVGIFSIDEITTIGVGNALKENNKNIAGIGFDITETIQKFIDEGYLKAVMVQSPYTMGYLGLAETVAALKGYDTGAPLINTGISIRTKYSH